MTPATQSTPKKYALFLNPDDFLYAEAVDRVLSKHSDVIDSLYLFPSRARLPKRLSHLLAGLRILGLSTLLELAATNLVRSLRARLTGRMELISISSAARRHGKPIFRFSDVNSPEVEQVLRSRGNTVILNICSQLYRKDAISRLPPIYNFHGGYVPGNAGRFPVFWAYMKDLPQTVTCHRVTEVIDGGEPLLHYALNSPKSESVWETTLKIRDRFPEIIERAIQLINDGKSETLALPIPHFYGPAPSFGDVARYRQLLRRARESEVGPRN